MRRWVYLCLFMALLVVSGTVSAEVTITHLAYISGGLEYQEYLKKKAPEFEKLHPGVKVEIVIGNQDKFQAMLAGGVPPDILDLPDFKYLGPLGQLVDLRPLLQKDGLMKAYNPIMLQRAMTPDGAIYNMPLDIGMYMTFFNRDLFNQAGLVSPDKLGTGWDWEATHNASKKTTIDRNGDGTPDSFGFDRAWGPGWREAVLQAGGWFYEFNDKMQPIRSLWNTAPVLAGIQFTERFYRERTTPHLFPGVDEKQYEFPTGKTAINVQDSLWAIGRGLQEVSFDWDIALLPRGSAGPITMGGVNGPHLVSATKHLNEAWEWLKFICANRENMIEYARTTGQLPALLSAQQTYPSLVNITNKNYKLIFEQVNYLSSGDSTLALPLNLTPRRVNLTPVWKGEVPTQTYLQSIHEKMSASIQEMLAAGK